MNIYKYMFGCVCVRVGGWVGGWVGGCVCVCVYDIGAWLEPQGQSQSTDPQAPLCEKIRANISDIQNFK